MFKFFGLTAALLFVLYVASPGEPCERVERSTLPVRVTFDALGALMHYWANDAQRLGMLVWGYQSDRLVKDLIARTLYGKAFAPMCSSGDPSEGAGRTAHAPDSSEPLELAVERL